MSLFANTEKKNLEKARPLAARMRPTQLNEFVGQRHFLGEGELLWRLVKADQLGSVIFYGPPGTGKTTLARILAGETQKQFVQISAIQTGVADLRKVLSEARDEVAAGGSQTLLFIDEIHRFNKSQQDALLPDVEDGVVVLIGATTANPFFAVNTALVSRSRVFQFEPHTEDDICSLLQRAISDRQNGLGNIEIKVDKGALEFLSRVCDGDARQALSTLEVAVMSCFEKPVPLGLDLIKDSIQKRAIQYDATGDEHYDLASALIKSIRGSDPDASLYWLARMLEGGEDIRFLCRRLVILASEDVGNADPTALSLAVACMQACEFVGLPECQLTLSQTVTYLSCAPKSNSATVAILEARSDIQKGRVVPVPKTLRDSHYQGAQSFDHGKGYQYSHNHEDGIASQDYLGVEKEYYQPVDRGFEKELRDRLIRIRRKLRESE
ncbi:replication-associated recombination protein A [Mariniblastus sp.]|jgi:putative ATPase|nr:replication-associated recombination protein A [Mariniblastus sp.]MDB4671776.1 replication-associated recombination protein A [Pirellulaceae bacterium]MDB4756562.1 replication-associated recombination protein A [Mariniblastus sp.]